MAAKKPPERARPAHLQKTAQDTSDQNSYGLERLIFFSDAVFAIAVTLLVLEIRLPDAGELTTDAQLLANLAGMLHKYLAYVISFLVIGTFWISHHRKFGYIRRYDSQLLFLNLLILMVVAFIPFPSSVISDNGNRTATIFYALSITLIGLLYAVLWWHAAYQGQLVDSHINAEQRRREFARPLLTSVVFILSIGISFFSSDLARLSWFLIVPVTLVANLYS